jgi:hypothetical protein
VSRLALRRIAPVFLVVSALVLAGCGDDSQVNAGGKVGEDARAWVEVAQPLINEDFAGALQAHTVLMKQLVGVWGTNEKSFRPQVVEGRRRFRALLGEARSLPGGSQEIDDVNRGFVRVLELMVGAYDDYLAGLSTGQFARMEVGDEKFLSAQAKVIELRPAVDKIIGQPEGFARQVRDLSTALSPITVQANQAMGLNADMLDALEAGRWDRANRKAKKAGRIFRTIVERLEQVPEPEDPRLARYLDSTLNGYRLMAAGFADYERGLPRRSIEILERGDRKVKRGLIDVQEASELVLDAVKAEGRTAG